MTHGTMSLKFLQLLRNAGFRTVSIILYQKAVGGSLTYMVHLFSMQPWKFCTFLLSAMW